MTAKTFPKIVLMFTILLILAEHWKWYVFWYLDPLFSLFREKSLHIIVEDFNSHVPWFHIFDGTICVREWQMWLYQYAYDCATYIGESGKITTLTSIPNNCYSVEHILKRIFLNENICILIQIFLNFVLKGAIIIRQHWFGYHSSMCHYLNHCWPICMTQYCAHRPKWVEGHWCPVYFAYGFIPVTQYPYTSLLCVNNFHTSFIHAWQITQ